MNTRKFPRTMQQAFGPYTDHRIYEPKPPASSSARYALGITYIVSFIAISAVLGGYL
jgi:hypothetical protein